MMADNILTQLESFSLNDDVEKTAKLKVYHSRLCSSGDKFLCENGYIVIKDFKNKKCDHSLHDLYRSTSS